MTLIGHFRIPPIFEDEVDQIVMAAGGRRAHPDADRRRKRGADYLLDDAVVELKILEEEGLEKQERRGKLASLFKSHSPARRPVIVLDRNSLPNEARRTFDRALEGPIKSAVSSAKEQLKQSRAELLDTNTSILWLVNNGYTALDHESLVKLIARRVRNDTSNIDGVVLSGCYFYSDTFDNFILWPFEYIPIRIDRAFKPFERLRQAWHGFATTRMTALITSEPDARNTKGPVVDTQFELDGVTYVKPAPPIGGKSSFFRSGRPRSDSSGLSRCPPVATVFGDLAYADWRRCRERYPNAMWLGETYRDWLQQRTSAEQTCVVKPLVGITVAFDDWFAWARQQPDANIATVHRYANATFERRIRLLLRTARERTEDLVLPIRSILVVTEEIGQDRANDVSHILEICESVSGEPQVEEVLVDQRMFHEYALAVGCAYAVARQIEVVTWQKDRHYAWY
jgi:hypothetical protein